MAVQNPNNVCTKQDLADFYTKIRPYLAGFSSGGGGGSDTLAGLDDVMLSSLVDNQVLKYDATAGKWVNGTGGGGTDYTAGEGIDIINDVISTQQSEAGDIDEIVDVYPQAGNLVSIVNAFNKGDIYSTQERMIGQWTDGKPLYQKTIYFEALSNMSYVTKPHGVSDLGEVVFLTGIASNGVARNVIPFAHDQSVASQILLMVNGADIEIDNRGYDYSTFHAYVTLQYTKTTDVAISIGEATEYSTEEKVVGTWIDGKPLYQKTVGITITGTNADYTHSIADIDKVIIKDAGLFDAVGNYLPNGFRNTTGATFFSCYANATYIHAITVSDYIGLSGYVTLQYTKTTT